MSIYSKSLFAKSTVHLPGKSSLHKKCLGSKKMIAAYPYMLSAGRLKKAPFVSAKGEDTQS